MSKDPQAVPRHIVVDGRLGQSSLPSQDDQCPGTRPVQPLGPKRAPQPVYCPSIENVRAQGDVLLESCMFHKGCLTVPRTLGYSPLLAIDASSCIDRETSADR